MKITNIAVIAVLFLSCFSLPSSAEIQLSGNDDYQFMFTPSLRTDVISLNNNVDLDSSNDDDKSTYFGLDYSLGFDLKFKKNGPEFYSRFNRTGPYGYDAPISIHNTLRTSTASVERYEGSDLLPELKEFWLDSTVGPLPVRLQGGLFGLNIGHGLIGGEYENYGVKLYNRAEGVPQWRVQYFLPDLVHKQRLGPIISQEKDQSIDYEHSNAHLMTADIAVPVHKDGTVQPYVSVLYDITNGKRSSYFATPTHKDTLGIAGVAYDAAFGKVTLELEAARNFGEAKSSDDAFADVEHQGYMLYEGLTYDLGRFKPRSHVIFASGNRVTTDMVDTGDSQMSGSKNRAFSSFSPLNGNLADALTQPSEVGPLVAMGTGWGLNYGVMRPTTFADATLFDNIFLWGGGFEQQLTEKFTVTLDGWVLHSAEKGVGTFNGSAVELSSDLGKEIDLTMAYDLHKNVALNFAAGYFWAGDFYEEERDDSDGSLFTPFVRGDGEADNAYQVELSMTVIF